MSTLLRHVALVSESPAVPTDSLLPVAAALQKQAARDLGPIWNISATVDPFPRLRDVPTDYWPIVIRDDIRVRQAGVHLDRNGQPFALVRAGAAPDLWSLTCSHEMCEMLVDPFGATLVAGASVHPDQGRVNYLVEVCDPSGGTAHAYRVNDVLVSDFYTPHFFDPVRSGGVRYSFNGRIPSPRTVLEGGYLSWHDLATDIWWQQVWPRGAAAAQLRRVGRLAPGGSLRAQIDRRTPHPSDEAPDGARGPSTAVGTKPDQRAEEAKESRAGALREEIGRLERDGRDGGDEGNG